jgi:hypothetical protein
MINWKIANMERHLEGDIVYTVHWTASLQDEELNASSYGSVGLQAPEEDIIPFEDLTEEIVVEWIKRALDAESIETALEAQIQLQKEPVSASGIPWS